MAKRKNNTLITGASGFLGVALTAHLAQSKTALYLAARKKIQAPIPKGAKTLYGDLTNPAYCTRILKGIDTVYYTAGFRKNIAIHTQTPFEALVENVTPLITFLRVAKKSKITKLIYTSSTHIEYASSSDENIDGYVWGKYINEMVVKAFAKETSVDVKIVRSAPFYGVGDGFDPKTATFIPSFIKRVVEAKDEVVIWGSGKRQMQFIYIDDLVRNMVRASASPRRSFCFGNAQRVSVNEVAHKIIELSGRKLPVRHDLTKPDKETFLSKFDNLEKPRIDMTSGLKKTLAYFRTLHA